MAFDLHVWWQSGVIYQVYPRSFSDSNGDGIGDLPGITKRLAYLHWLGVDALWISPFYPSPMVDAGYDVSDYTDVDPVFGDLAAFDTLVQQAHEYGIKIIIDFVINHTSDQHPWFLESRASKEHSRRSWYVWADPKADGSPPNNWLSLFGGPAWDLDTTTGQYYLHSFAPQQPDLNWRNPEVQQAMFDVVRFWLEHEVDGLRIDAAQMIMKDPLLRDNPLNQEKARVTYKPMGSAYEEYVHLHDKEHPDIHEVYRSLRSLLDSYSQEQPRVALGELHILDRAVWASYYGANLDEIHIPFNFDMVFAPWDARSVRQSVETLQASLPPGAWPSYVLGNHDEARVASRIGPVQARLAMFLLLTLRGTPTLYYGDELGMHNGDIPAERMQDPIERRQPGQGLGRDPERTPMQWDQSPNAGFCPPEVEPWLPVPDDYLQANVALEREDPRSLLTLTQRLIALRRSAPALNIGSYQPVEDVPEDCFVYVRQSGRQRYLVALNFSMQEQVVRLPEFGRGQMLLSTSCVREGPVDLTLLELAEGEGCAIDITLPAAEDEDAL